MTHRRRVLAITLVLVCTVLAVGWPPERASLVSAATVTGNIGGYPEAVSAAALAVEANGRVHVLWTGELSPYFDDFAFYSASNDGVNWKPYQILNYWQVYDPQIAVDDTHHRPHLMYRSNYDGIIHHTVSGRVASDGKVVDADSAALPQMAVDPTTGFVYAVWRQGYYHRLDEITYSWRQQTWYAYWNGATWSPRQRVINDRDTWDSTVAAAPGGGVMLAWFQRWAQSLGGATDPGLPIVPRTAYGTEPTKLSLRQAVSDEYEVPERDESILLTYSPADDKYYMACDHFMWPGHSRVYRYTWKDGTWSTPLDVSANPSGWGVPSYIGAATDSPLVYYVYTDQWVLKLRTETEGVLSAPQSVADYLAARGYTGTPLAYFVDRSGDLHMVVSGTKDDVEGFYYVSP